MMHMTYLSQLKEKKEAVRESIRKYSEYDLSKTVFKDVIKADKQTGYITVLIYQLFDLKIKSHLVFINVKVSI